VTLPNATQWVQIIKTLGFPIVVAGACFWFYAARIYPDQRADREREMVSAEKFRDDIASNTRQQTAVISAMADRVGKQDEYHGDLQKIVQSLAFSLQMLADSSMEQVAASNRVYNAVKTNGEIFAQGNSDRLAVEAKAAESRKAMKEVAECLEKKLDMLLGNPLSIKKGSEPN
jgi:hypothetical protein